jgi:hypothetical protein
MDYKEDWEEAGLSYFAAFKARKLLKSDYRIFFSSILNYFFAKIRNNIFY